MEEKAKETVKKNVKEQVLNFIVTKEFITLTDIENELGVSRSAALLYIGRLVSELYISDYVKDKGYKVLITSAFIKGDVSLMTDYEKMLSYINKMK